MAFSVVSRVLSMSFLRGRPSAPGTLPIPHKGLSALWIWVGISTCQGERDAATPFVCACFRNVSYASLRSLGPQVNLCHRPSLPASGPDTPGRHRRGDTGRKARSSSSDKSVTVMAGISVRPSLWAASTSAQPPTTRFVPSMRTARSAQRRSK